jgi:hypothetical protein
VASTFEINHLTLFMAVPGETPAGISAKAPRIWGSSRIERAVRNTAPNGKP